MKQITTILLAGTIAFFVNACGGGGSSTSSASAQDLLEGNSFYYTDIYLDFEDGYYKESFGTDLLTSTEHMPDGTVIDQWTEIVPISYSGTTVIVTDEGNSQSCEVVGADTYVVITCPSRPTFILWTTIEDAQANPQ